MVWKVACKMLHVWFVSVKEVCDAEEEKDSEEAVEADFHERSVARTSEEWLARPRGDARRYSVVKHAVLLSVGRLPFSEC